MGKSLTLKLTTYSKCKSSRQDPELLQTLLAFHPSKPVKRDDCTSTKQSGYRKIMKIDRSFNVANDLVYVLVGSLVSDLVGKKRPLHEDKIVTAVEAVKLPCREP